MSTLSAYTSKETLTPLVDCTVDNRLIKLRPFLKETSLEMIHVSYPHTIHSILKHSPDFVIERVKIGTVRWPQYW